MTFKVEYDLFIHYFCVDWKITKNIYDVPLSCFNSIRFEILINLSFLHFNQTLNFVFDFNKNIFENNQLQYNSINNEIENQIIKIIRTVVLNVDRINNDLLVANFNSMSLSDIDRQKDSFQFITSKDTVNISIDTKTEEELSIIGNLNLILNKCYLDYCYIYNKYLISTMNNSDIYMEATLQLNKELSYVGIV